MLGSHEINPPSSEMTENRSGKAERDPAPQQTSNSKRITDFRRSQVCDSRPPRCTGQMTLENSADDGAGALRVQNRRREPDCLKASW